MDFQTWLHIQLNWRDESGLWLLGSFLLYVLASNVAWILGRKRSGPLGRAVDRLQAWPGSHWLVMLLRWAYFVGPAYATLLLGVVSPRWMGLSEVDWVHSAGMGSAVAAAALGLLSLSWWSYRRARPVRQNDVGVPFGPRPLRWLLVLMQTAALQAHWAFYRSSFITQTWLADPYWGSWAGWTLVCLEWALNPWLRHGLRRPDQAEPILRRAVLALVTTALFILTRNVWLCWALHALFEAGAEYGSRQVDKDTRRQGTDRARCSLSTCFLVYCLLMSRYHEGQHDQDDQHGCGNNGHPLQVGVDVRVLLGEVHLGLHCPRWRGFPPRSRHSWRHSLFLSNRPGHRALRLGPSCRPSSLLTPTCL